VSDQAHCSNFVLSNKYRCLIKAGACHVLIGSQIDIIAGGDGKCAENFQNLALK